MPDGDFTKEFSASKEGHESALHVHIFHRHVPTPVSFFVLILSALAVGVAVFFSARGIIPATEVVIKNSETGTETFVYGSWPALQNAEFFKSVKQGFISQGVSFIEADLSEMVIRFYQNGRPVKEAIIQTKGREGSWWETPAGLYKVVSKEESHFSSFGRVYMPWSMQFQGNFFIHGPTHYPDGAPTSAAYSGGCIRLSLEDAKKIYGFAKRETPVLVFEKSFDAAKETVRYTHKQLLSGGASYIVADLGNNFVFAENNSAKEQSIASIAKLMAALVAVEYINVEREVKIDSYILASTSIPRLQEKENVSVLDLLSLLLLESSNEAALAIARPLGGSSFVKLMNEKAEAIGMRHSNFVDTSGVLSANTSSAEDLFLLAKYLYYNRSFVLHMSMGKENRTAYSSPKYKDLVNLNMIPSAPGMIGGKVGLSTAAGDSMLAVFEIKIGGDMRPIAIVVLGSDDSKRDIKMLLEYIRNNFSLVPGLASS